MEANGLEGNALDASLTSLRFRLFLNRTRNFRDWTAADLRDFLLKMMIVQENTEKKRRMRRMALTTRLASVINRKMFMIFSQKVA
jgi:hypothetical protein